MLVTFVTANYHLCLFLTLANKNVDTFVVLIQYPVQGPFNANTITTTVYCRNYPSLQPKFH